jgi:hypothetical protein
VRKTKATGIPTFYLDKNAPRPKAYIVENLVVPVED